MFYVTVPFVWVQGSLGVLSGIPGLIKGLKCPVWPTMTGHILPSSPGVASGPLVS